MQLHRETVKMANVQRTKIRMEAVIEEGIIDAEVDRWMYFWPSC